VKDQQYPPPPPIPQNRPALNNTNKRYSVSGMTGLGSPTVNGKNKSLAVSHYSPRITNITENTWVWNTFLLDLRETVTRLGYVCSLRHHCGTLLLPTEVRRGANIQQTYFVLGRILC
jgi:hypothetical protein